MRKFALIVGSFLILMSITACTSNENDYNRFELLEKKSDQGVNLWTSVNYQIITDRQIIEDIDKPITDIGTPILIEIIVKTVNKGRGEAQGIELNFNEPTPFLQTNGSLNGGVNSGHLKHNEEYEYYFTYIFRNHNDLMKFISESYISIKWKENDEEKEQKILLPSKPMDTGTLYDILLKDD